MPSRDSCWKLIETLLSQLFSLNLECTASHTSTHSNGTMPSPLQITARAQAVLPSAATTGTEQLRSLWLRFFLVIIFLQQRVKHHRTGAAVVTEKLNWQCDGKPITQNDARVGNAAPSSGTFLPLLHVLCLRVPRPVSRAQMSRETWHIMLSGQRVSGAAP